MQSTTRQASECTSTFRMVKCSSVWNLTWSVFNTVTDQMCACVPSGITVTRRKQGALMLTCFQSHEPNSELGPLRRKVDKNKMVNTWALLMPRLLGSPHQHFLWFGFHFVHVAHIYLNPAYQIHMQVFCTLWSKKNKPNEYHLPVSKSPLELFCCMSLSLGLWG